MTARRFDDDVNAALERARREARDAELQPALRARILAAARAARSPSAPSGPNGRILDFVLRAAAVAAAFAAVLLVLPPELSAAEFDARPLLDLNERLTASIAGRLPSLDLDAPTIPRIADGVGPALTVVAVALVGCGLWTLRRERRP